MIVLVGGLAMRAREFSELIEKLETLQLKAISFDNYAVAGQSVNDIPLTIEHQARFQWERIEQVTTEPVDLFGISMGAMIAATMATVRPSSVRHLVLAATSANTPSHPAIPNHIYEEWIHASTPETVSKAITIAFGKTTLREKPDIVKDYLTYRLTRQNQQSPQEFVAQLDSIRVLNQYEA
jgi:pimeloyl-ACP methyl ester carboxylesterase